MHVEEKIIEQEIKEGAEKEGEGDGEDKERENLAMVKTIRVRRKNKLMKRNGSKNKMMKMLIRKRQILKLKKLMCRYMIHHRMTPMHQMKRKKMRKSNNL